MEYKTILVHVDQSRHAATRIHFAAALARIHGALLIGAAMTGLPRYVFPDGAWPIPLTLAASCFEPLYDKARRALEQFADITAAYDIACEPRLVTDQDADALVLLARFADLVVVTQDDPDEALPGQVARLPEYVALHATAPALIVPLDWTAPGAGHQILVAWNGSAACARAVHAALPLLRQARNVRLASLRAPTDAFAQDIAAEQAQLAASLGRHGVQVQLCVRDEDVDAGHAILALARETGCDLIVMGCYGHARFREMLLGGASRTMLRSATVPTLMLH
ncbi:universal stress protein [Massilia sp. S19_KUP03_FR1]|uniref:universal stress protein n=1 Tax=Massilia sp. S19_KUP03_FR1 TaxID=3025503 RepID=UPI002FCDB991